MENVKTIQINVVEQLKNLATEKEKSFDELLGLYLQERLLYRLSVSTYQDRFLLKGDHLLFSLTNGAVKSPVEIALSAKQMAFDINLVKRAFNEICSIKMSDDSVHFFVDELVITSEKEEICIKIPVKLAQTKTYIQVRISFWDSRLLAPKKVVFTSLLEMATPEILAYPTELIIAEKFEGIYSLLTLESRMKDFYDIYMLSSTQSVEGRVLQEAIMITFDRHRTIIEKDHPVFSKQFYLDTEKNKQWQAFIGHKSLAFEEVVKCIQTLLLPIYNVIVEEDEFLKNWDYELQDWK